VKLPITEVLVLLPLVIPRDSATFVFEYEVPRFNVYATFAGVAFGVAFGVALPLLTDDFFVALFVDGLGVGLEVGPDMVIPAIVEGMGVLVVPPACADSARIPEVAMSTPARAMTDSCLRRFAGEVLFILRLLVSSVRRRCSMGPK
jgi:hypothetical protein